MEQAIIDRSTETRPSPSSGETGSSESAVDSLTNLGSAWYAVLARLAIAFPGSALSRMGDQELTDTARSWEQDLGEVPLEAIPDLYARVIRNCVSDFAPSLGTFNATWQSWDYWAEQNSDPEAPGPRAPAAPALVGPVSKELPRSMRLMRQWMAAGLPPITCKCPAPPARGTCWQCKQPEGKCTCRRRAEMHQSGAFWHCGDGACGFDYSLDRMEADLRAKTARPPQESTKAPKIAPRGTSAPESAPESEAPPAMSDGELVRRLTEQTGINLSDQAVLTDFARFMYREIPDTTLWTTNVARGQWAKFCESRSKLTNG